MKWRGYYAQNLFVNISRFWSSCFTINPFAWWLTMHCHVWRPESEPFIHNLPYSRVLKMMCCLSAWDMRAFGIVNLYANWQCMPEACVPYTQYLPFFYLESVILIGIAVVDLKLLQYRLCCPWSGKRRCYAAKPVLTVIVVRVSNSAQNSAHYLGTESL